MSELITERWFSIPGKALTHPVQSQLKKDLLQKKYSQYVIPAGRRSFKTERFIKRYAVNRFLEGGNQTIFIGAPTRIQAKSIFWKDMKALTPKWIIKNVSESELSITAISGNMVQVIGLKEFKRVQGVMCHCALISEYQECDPNVWDESFQPMLNDTGGIAVKEGRPLGKNHFYDDYLRGLSGEHGIKSYHWTSEEILSEFQIENAKRELGKADYEREYLASFETGSSPPYYAYTYLNHSDYKLNMDIPVLVMCDFNATEKPMSWNLGQRIVNNVFDVTHITKTFSYQYTNTETMCGILEDYFNEIGYPKHLIFYGDYSGKQEKSNSSYSDWRRIENFFSSKVDKFEKRIKPCTSIRNTIDGTNAQLCNSMNERKLFVNPEECKPLIRDWEKCEWKENSKELKDNDNLRGHACRAVDYYNDFEHPLKGTPEAVWRN